MTVNSIQEVDIGFSGSCNRSTSATEPQYILSSFSGKTLTSDNSFIKDYSSYPAFTYGTVSVTLPKISDVTTTDSTYNQDPLSTYTYGGTFTSTITDFDATSVFSNTLSRSYPSGDLKTYCHPCTNTVTSLKVKKYNIAVPYTMSIKYLDGTYRIAKGTYTGDVYGGIY
jgi:hypothetical protein